MKTIAVVWQMIQALQPGSPGALEPPSFPVMVHSVGNVTALDGLNSHILFWGAQQ